MNIISTTVEYKGTPVKIENGRVFLRSFGTTIHKQNIPHWSWTKIEEDNMKEEFKQFLKDNNLL